MRPVNNDKLPINHLWGIVERAKDNSEQRVFPTDVFFTRREARNALREWKKTWANNSRFLSVRKLNIEV